MRPHQIALILAAVVSVLGLVVAPIGVVLTPLQLLNTHLHELSHALVALLTSGSVQAIYVHGNGSGETPVAGGVLALVASAGYLGAAAAGAAMVWAMRTETGARRALGLVGGALALSVVFFVHGDAIGVLSGIVWAALLLIAWKTLRGGTLLFVTALLGLQQGINAVRSLTELLQISATTETQSDALLMQRATLVPAVFWAGLWAAIGIAIVVLTVRRVWSPSRPATPFPRA